MSNPRSPYALISFHLTPLAECDLGSTGNYKRIARDLLSKLKFDGSRSSYEQGDYVFTVWTDKEGLSIIILTEKTVQASQRLYIIEELRTAFLKEYEKSYKTAAEMSFNSEFSRKMGTILRNWSTDTSATMAQIKENLQETQAIMTQNLAAALQRNATLEVLEGKSEGIKDGAKQFERRAVNVKRQMCCNRYKWWIMVAVAVLVIVAIIILIVALKKK